MNVFRKRIVTELVINAETEEQADKIRDAVGNACGEDFLMPIVVEVMEANKMTGPVDWSVIGQTWRGEDWKQ